MGRKNMTVGHGIVEVVIVLLIMAGAFMVFVGSNRAYEAYSSQSWPTVIGEILTANVDARQVGNARTYHFTVRYAYAINDPASEDDYFVNDRIDVLEPPVFEDRASGERALAYTKGEPVEVYYNPNRPQRSLLIPIFRWSMLIYPSAGVVVLLIALGLWLNGRRKG